jgi:hypothetical protein
MVIVDGKAVDFATLPEEQKRKISIELQERFARSIGATIIKKAK